MQLHGEVHHKAARLGCAGRARQHDGPAPDTVAARAVPERNAARARRAGAQRMSGRDRRPCQHCVAAYEHRARCRSLSARCRSLNPAGSGPIYARERTKRPTGERALRRRDLAGERCRDNRRQRRGLRLQRSLLSARHLCTRLWPSRLAFVQTDLALLLTRPFGWSPPHIFGSTCPNLLKVAG